MASPKRPKLRVCWGRMVRSAGMGMTGATPQEKGHADGRPRRVTEDGGVRRAQLNHRMSQTGGGGNAARSLRPVQPNVRSRVGRSGGPLAREPAGARTKAIEIRFDTPLL